MLWSSATTTFLLFFFFFLKIELKLMQFFFSLLGPWYQCMWPAPARNGQITFNPAPTTGRILHFVLNERFFRHFTQQGPGQLLDWEICFCSFMVSSESGLRPLVSMSICLRQWALNNFLIYTTPFQHTFFSQAVASLQLRVIKVIRLQ